MAEIERGVFDIETVKKANQTLIDTIEDSLRIADEGRRRRKEATSQLETLEKMIQLVAESENDGDLIPLDILPLKDTSRDGDAEVKTSSKGRESIH